MLRIVGGGSKVAQIDGTAWTTLAANVTLRLDNFFYLDKGNFLGGEPSGGVVAVGNSTLITKGLINVAGKVFLGRNGEDALGVRVGIQGWLTIVGYYEQGKDGTLVSSITSTNRANYTTLMDVTTNPNLPANTRNNGTAKIDGTVVVNREATYQSDTGDVKTFLQTASGGEWEVQDRELSGRRVEF